MAQANPEITSIIRLYLNNLKDMGVPVDRVYLFGSYARQEADTESDVDLAVISPLFENMSLWDRAGYLGKAAWNITYPLDVLGFAPSQVKKALPGSFLRDIIKNGLEIKH